DELARGRKRLAKSGRIADSAGAVGGEEGLPAGEAARLRLARRRRRRQARGVDERVREIEIVLDERRRAGGERGPVDVAVAEERRQLRLAANHLAGVTGIREEVAVQKRDVGTASLDGAQVIEREDGLV